MKTLTSLQNPLVKHLTKLRLDKAYRFQNRSVIILGHKMIYEVSKITPIRCLLSEQELSLHAEEKYLVCKEMIKKISGVSNPESALAMVDMPPYQDLSSKEKIILLDGIKDPGNLGTIIRTAHGLGFDGVHLLENCVDPFNDKALRSAKGSTFFLPIGKGPLSFPGRIYAADLRGSPIEDVEFQKPLAILLGSESHGISEKWASNSEKVAIPLSNGVDSFNVAIAGAIFMYIIAHE